MKSHYHLTYKNISLIHQPILKAVKEKLGKRKQYEFNTTIQHSRPLGPGQHNRMKGNETAGPPDTSCLAFRGQQHHSTKKSKREMPQTTNCAQSTTTKTNKQTTHTN